MRAIALRYGVGQNQARLERAQARMLQEWRRGYLLERFFFEQLAAYEQGRRTLREEYPHMLDHLDTAHELARWQREQR